MKIAQMHTVYFKADAVSNVAMAMDKIHKEEGWESYLIADLFSDFEDVPVFASGDYDHSPLITRLLYMASRFLRLSNKKLWLLQYFKAHKQHKPGIAKNIIESADIRIWQFGAFYTLFRYFHRSDILFYHGITDPYLSYLSEFAIYSKNMLQAMLDMNPFVIVQSEFIKQSLIDLGFKKESINILPLFHKYNLSHQKHHESKPNLVSWGRYALSKGIPELVKFTNKNKINLRVFGDNFQTLEFHDQYQEALKNNISNYAIITGKVDDFEKELQKANIYICNSYHEGFNMPLIEAEAHSIPILARKGTAMDELVKNGYNGYLFNDINEVPELINKIMKNYKQFSYNALEHSKNYTYEKFKRNYLSIINKYINSKIKK